MPAIFLSPMKIRNKGFLEYINTEINYDVA